MTDESLSELSEKSKQPARYQLELAWFVLGVGLFWLLQFWYQYYVYEPGNFSGAWIRSHSLSGTTLVAAALLLSIIFKFQPAWAGEWRWRRRLGVAGVLLITFHIGGVLKYGYLYNLAVIFFSWNPFINPALFGLFVYPILLVMLLTSTDWMVRHLKKWWKFLHRFVYLAELGIVFHVILLGRRVLKSPPGYLLYALGAAVILGQVYWWYRISRRRNFQNAGFMIGLGLLVLALALSYWAWQQGLWR